MSAARVEPRVTWPRSVAAGEPFLVCVDLALVGVPEELWPFDEEELEFTCVLDGGRHFGVEAVHDASVVMHRFGGTYGPAQFVVVAQGRSGQHALRLTPVTSRGIVMGSVELPVTVGAAGEEQDAEGELRSVDLARAAASGGPAALPGRSALCIAVGRYSDRSGLQDLPGVYAAGQRVVDALRELGYRCTYMTDPGGPELLEAVQQFMSSDEAPLQVVYFGGHGLAYDGEFFLAGTDAGTGSPREARLIPFRYLSGEYRLRGDEDRATLFLLDACYSGAAAHAGRLGFPVRSDALRQGSAHSSYVVASSGSSEPSYSSLFSHSLADVLEQAAAGRLGVMPPGEAVSLSAFVRETDRRMRERAPDLLQTLTSSLVEPGSTLPAFFPVLAPLAADRPPASPSLRVVGVPGTGNQHSGPSLIASRWLPLIQDGLRLADPLVDPSAIDLSIAYYSDLLVEPYVQGGAAPGENDAQGAQPGGREPEVSADLPGAAKKQPARAGGKLSALRWALDYLTRSRGAAATRPLQKALISVMGELNRYLRDEYREAVVARVHGSFTDSSPQVVLAHSLGAVAAYEALWQEPYPQVDVLVTMGSPLAFPPVLERLGTSERQRPPGVSQWVDLADVADVMAIPVNGVAKAFHGVDALRTHSRTLNPHVVTEYLKSPELGAVLAGLLQQTSPS
ncbi:caspase family protein [Streptomyces sp. SP2-10]|uniref:caspase family protein n=1 Tax=Streptomyces sp. SP2-10 TaxID=2873385 RepID=UPI001CA625FE|nr:caspase family protein [Streptomyces sp. SP2-10]MBY8846058.1 caspase family protein [Streptomyces sp. SP2-10]